MKTLLLALSLALGVGFLTPNLNARIVTLTLSGTKTNDSVTIGTNESLTILCGRDNPFDSNVRVQKEGVNISNDFQLEYFAPSRYTANSVPKFAIAGPAVVSIYGPNLNPGFAFLTLDIQPDSFPPDKAVIVPEGSGANIVLESSTNLVHWSPATPGLYTNQTGNLFFRIRADRIP